MSPRSTFQSPPGARFTESFLLGLLASAHVAAGAIKEAADLLRNALSSIEATDERWFEAAIHRLIGELALRDSSSWTGVEAQAENEFTIALEIARRQNAKLWELRAATSLGRLRRQQGRLSEAHDLLAPIYGWFRNSFEMPDLEDAKKLLEELG
jgi:predicted ATPase